MVKLRSKLFLVLALGTTLVGCGNTLETNRVNSPFNEMALDAFSNNMGVRFQADNYIGNDATIAYSDVKLKN